MTDKFVYLLHKRNFYEKQNQAIADYPQAD